MRRIWDFIDDHLGLSMAAFVIIVFGGLSWWIIWYNNKWVCLRSHEEWSCYTDPGTGIVQSQLIDVCDEEMLRTTYDSIIKAGGDPYNQ